MQILAVVAAACAAMLLVPPRFLAPARAAPTPRPSTGRPGVPVSTLSGLSAFVAVLVLVPQPVGMVAAPVAAWMAVRVVRRLEPAALRRRRSRLEATLPQVVDLMSSCLAAGASPGGALGEILDVVDPEMRDELAPFAAGLGLGADPTAVWSSMARHPQLGPLGRTLHRSAESGASVADALGRLGDELRAARRAAAEAMARTVEVKSSLPLGLCLLPAFVLVGIVPLVAGSFSLTFIGAGL